MGLQERVNTILEMERNIESFLNAHFLTSKYQNLLKDIQFSESNTVKMKKKEWAVLPWDGDILIKIDFSFGAELVIPLGHISDLENSKIFIKTIRKIISEIEDFLQNKDTQEKGNFTLAEVF